MYAWVLQYGLIGVVDFLVHSRQTFDWHVVDVGDGDMRDFRMKVTSSWKIGMEFSNP
jgi:hypothetical protein